MPHYFWYLASREKACGSSWKPSVCEEIAKAPEDPRIWVGVEWESEYRDVYWGPKNDWNRESGANGYDMGFRRREMPHRVEFEDAVFWRAAQAAPSSKFPRTAARIDQKNGKAHFKKKTRSLNL